MTKISAYPRINSWQANDLFIVARESTVENFSASLGDLLSKGFTGVSEGSAVYKLGLDSNGAIVKFTEQSATGIYQHLILTDADSVAWDIASKVVSTALLDTSRTAITLTVQNLIEGTHHTLYVRKQSASNLTFTFGSSVYPTGGTSLNGGITLTGSANTLYKVDIAKVNGSVLTAVSVMGDNVTAYELTDGDKGDITVSGGGTVWTIDNGAVTDAKIVTVSWAKITGKPTTLAGYGISDPVVTTDQFYNNPSWITGLEWSKIFNTPTTIAGYNITDPLLYSDQSYADPTWLVSLDYSKILNAPQLVPLTLEYNGVDMPDRPTINFANAITVVDAPITDKLDVTWGGALTKNTVVTGNNIYNIAFSGITKFTVNSFFTVDPVVGNIIAADNNTITGATGSNLNHTAIFGEEHQINATAIVTDTAVFGWHNEIGDGVNAYSGSSGLTVGAWNKNYAVGAVVIGQRGRALANVRGGLVVALNLWDDTSPYVTVDGAAINISHNTVSQTEGYGSLGEYGAIIGGQDHHIPATSPRSAILGGNAIIARASEPDQVYVPNLNIVTAPLNDDALTQVLVRDGTTGQIKYRTIGSIGAGDFWKVTGSTTLTGAVTVNGTDVNTITFLLDDGASNNGNFYLDHIGFYSWVQASNTHTAEINVANVAGVTQAQLHISGTVTNTLDLMMKSDGTFTVYSNGFTFAGIQYGADYSANYTARSLVDKAYVDALPNQTITLSGDVSGSGTGAITTAIGANKVTLSMMAQVATARFLGRTTAGTGNVESLTVTQATAMLNLFSTTATTKGLVVGSNNLGNTYFLRADGSWAEPPSGGNSVGAQYELQESDGAGGFVASQVFTEATKTILTLGSGANTSTERTITVAGSQTDINLNLKAKNDGNIVFDAPYYGNVTVLLRSNVIQQKFYVRKANANNAIAYLLTLQGDGGAATGVGTGVGIEFNQKLTTTVNGGLIECYATDATSTSEDFKYSFKLMTNGAAPAEKMSLSSTGELYVSGDAKFGSADNSRWLFDDGSDRFGVVKKAGSFSKLVYGSGSNFAIALSSVANLYTTAVSSQTLTDVMAFDASGNVGIGITPTVRLDVRLSSGGTGATIAKFGSTTSDRINLIDETVAGAIPPKIFFNAGAGGGLDRPDGAPLIFYKNATEQARIDTSGNFTLASGTGTATDWIATSDARLKTNIHPISNALDLVNRIIGYTYNRIDLEDKDITHYGFVAQQLETVVPELVTTVNGIKAVNYDKVVPILVQAIKELQSKLNS